MRQNIERAFGVLVTKWGILWRALKVEFIMIPTLLIALAKLHNFCIDENDEATRERETYDTRKRDSLRVHVNPEEKREVDEDERIFLDNAIERRRRRNGFRSIFQRMGCKRPSHSAHTRA